MYVTAHRTAIDRMFISMDLAEKTVDAIVNKQDYKTPHTLSHLYKKGVKILVIAICKPSR